MGKKPEKKMHLYWRDPGTGLRALYAAIPASADDAAKQEARATVIKEIRAAHGEAAAQTVTQWE